MARNYSSIDYPREKLEWIIVDDSPQFIDYKPLEKLGARVLRINKAGTKKYNIGHKRNFINCLAKHDYIVHIDDDDFYPAYSVVSRIRVLLKHEKETGSPGCVGCNKVNCYDLITNKTFEAFDLDSAGNPSTVSESTLAYSKKFLTGTDTGTTTHKAHKYTNTDMITECIDFIGDYQVCVIPSSFVITQLTHNSNTVVRRPNSQGDLRKTAQLFDYNFMDTISTMDSNILNNIKTQIIMKIPEYQQAIDFVREILSYQQNKPKNYNKIIQDRFEDLELRTDSDTIALLKNQLVLNIRYEYLQTKTKSSGKDIVYYCGPGDILCHMQKWSPASKILGGSEEAVIHLSEYMVAQGYKVTVYNVLDGPNKKYNGVMYKNYWQWTPRDAQDITIFWRDFTIIKNLPKINSTKVYLDLHDAIEIKHKVNCDAIFVKSNFHKEFITYNDNVVVVPNGIKTFNLCDSVDIKENFALCTSSPDRCLYGLLKALPLIRAKVPDFKIYWAYGFSNAITSDTRPEVQEWYKKVTSLMSSTEGFVNLDRLSQDEIEEYYKKAKYFIYGTRFPEIDCISLTKALSAKCIPLIAGNGALSEKMKAIDDMKKDTNVQYVETAEEYNEFDKSLYDGPDFDKWIEKCIITISVVDEHEYEHIDDEFDTTIIKNYIDNKYSYSAVYSKWLK